MDRLIHYILAFTHTDLHTHTVLLAMQKAADTNWPHPASSALHLRRGTCLILITAFLMGLSWPLNMCRDEHLKTFSSTLEQPIDALFDRRCVGDVIHLKNAAVRLVETHSNTILLDFLLKRSLGEFCPISILFTPGKGGSDRIPIVN